jgi:hypothetical protein
VFRGENYTVAKYSQQEFIIPLENIEIHALGLIESLENILEKISLTP